MKYMNLNMIEIFNLNYIEIFYLKFHKKVDETNPVLTSTLSFAIKSLMISILFTATATYIAD